MPARWVVGAIMNMSGNIIINFGTNLMKLGHNNKRHALEEASNGGGDGRHAVRGDSTTDASDLKDELELHSMDGSTRASAAGGDEEEDGGKGSLDSQESQDSTTSHAGLVSSVDPRLGKAWEWMKKRVWGVGAFLLVLGSVINFVSFSFGSQAMLAGLGSIQFVSNVVFVRFVLGETVTRKTVFATCVIVAGQAMVLAFSPHASRTYDVQQLQRLWIDGRFLGYLFVLCCMLIVLAYIYWKYTRREIDGRPLKYSHIVRPTAYAMFSAMIGTKSVLQAKCLSELLRSTLSGNNQMGYIFTYITLFLWLALTVFWLNRMNTSLKYFDGVFIIPVLQVFWTFFAVLDGFIYFQDYEDYHPGRMTGFIFGVIIIFAGVYLLCPEREDKATRSPEGVHDDGEQDDKPAGSRMSNMLEELRRGAMVANEAVLALIRETGLFGAHEDQGDQSLLRPDLARSTNIAGPYSPSSPPMGDAESAPYVVD